MREAAARGCAWSSAPRISRRAIRTARSEAGAAFGDSSIYLERRILQPRHVEIQLLGDQHGTVLPFVERECSIQRRHQKVVEESPSIAVDPDLRRRMAGAAASLARSVGYTSAGTMEFLLDADGSFYFLEMNTRLQVEHPVTEMVTGLDLVQWQIRIARGEALDLDPERALTPRGHAIECRIYAEDPDQGFMPSPGLIRGLRPASGPGVRDDGGVSAGYEVPVYYDSLIAKLVAWGDSRDMAIDRMSRALREYQVLGIRTTIPFFQWLMTRAEYREGRYDTTYLDRLLIERRGESFTEIDAAGEELLTIAAGLDAYFRASAATGGPATVRTGPSPWLLASRKAALRGMTFEIELGGRSRRVAIEPAGTNRFRVTVDDVVHLVDAVRVGASGLSLLIDGDAGASRDAEVVAGPHGESLVWLDGQSATATIDGRRARGSRGDAAAHAEGAQAIVAPMPGRVVRFWWRRATRSPPASRSSSSKL